MWAKIEFLAWFSVLSYVFHSELVKFTDTGLEMNPEVYYSSLIVKPNNKTLRNNTLVYNNTSTVNSTLEYNVTITRGSDKNVESDVMGEILKEIIKSITARVGRFSETEEFGSK